MSRCVLSHHIQAPDSYAALVCFAIAGDEVADPIGLKSFVELRVGVVRIVLDVYRIGRAFAVGRVRIAAGRNVLDAVAGT